ncbi:DUF4097 and DUF4098 domain-containing protein YvlB [Bacillus sp. 491mf]|uniref:DUF4097 family beta strand repeat-containing protein n=1 Tax=Bacillus sp. 491mf TaxID=1761755 RepID=UPI0008DEF948|nr:DUF4097 family beta strand repeat-containing protein [Bacillus sp. 491mf]SFD00255.1 DUF4097 and DUF4098 domain-containing protein YvlB [Bacillus sp. 491mf]
MRKVVLIAFVCIAIGGIGLFITSSAFFIKAANGAVETKKLEQKQFKNEQIKNIHVDTDVGDVVIEKGQTDLFEVRYSSDQEKRKLNVNENGEMLQVEVKMKKKHIFDFSFFSFDLKDDTLTIIVPERVYNKIEAETAAGTIRVENIQSGNISAHSAAGDVKMKEIKAQNVKVSSSAGDIVLHKVEGKVRADSAAGSVEIAQHNPEYSVEADSAAGDVNIKLKEMPKDAVVKGSANVGEVQIFGKENKEITLGNGKVQIKGKTSAGSIKIEVD